MGSQAVGAVVLSAWPCIYTAVAAGVLLDSVMHFVLQAAVYCIVILYMHYRRSVYSATVSVNYTVRWLYSVSCKGTLRRRRLHSVTLYVYTYRAVAVQPPDHYLGEILLGST